jgi:hypothetical protein
METESDADEDGTQLQNPPETEDGTQLKPIQNLPEILAVIKGTLAVATDDDFVGLTTARGFEYLLAREFARQQPALSLLYDLEFEITGPSFGSRHYHFNIFVKLKKRVKAELRKAGAIAIIGLALSIPGATLTAIQLYDRLIPPVEIQLNSDMPYAPIKIELHAVHLPDSGTAKYNF